MFTYFKHAVSNSKPAQQYITAVNSIILSLKLVTTPASSTTVQGKTKLLIKQCLETGLLSESNIIARTGEPAYMFLERVA